MVPEQSFAIPITLLHYSYPKTYVGNTGEALPLPPDLRVIFESGSLASASPGAVGRCGVTSFSGDSFGSWHLTDTWVEHSSPDELAVEERLALASALDALVKPLLAAARRGVWARLASATELSMIQGTLSMLGTLLRPLREPGACERVRSRGLAAHLDACALLACVWGIGAVAANEGGRKAFDAELRALLRGPSPEERPLRALTKLPVEGLCFDHAWGGEGMVWCSWMDLLPEEQALDHIVDSMVVRTADMACCSQITWMSCMAGNQLMLCGPLGVGKTVYMREVCRSLRQAEFERLQLQFSAHVCAGEVQRTVDGMLSKRERSTFGPPAGKACAIFVDDVGMPSSEPGDLQQPLELLRHLCSAGGWYECSDLAQIFRNIMDCFLMASTRSQDGGQCVPPRLRRYFQVVGVLSLSAESISQILCQKLRHAFLDCPAEVTGLVDRLAAATTEICLRVCEILPPTPSMPQRALGTIDAARIVGGIAMLGSPGKADAAKLARLWAHECSRVLADRLGLDTDRDVVLGLIREVSSSRLGLPGADAEGVSQHWPLFSNLLLDKVPSPAPRYVEIDGVERLHRVFAEGLALLGSGPDAEAPEITVSATSLHHLMRIARAIRQPFGHALLLGSPQSGRRSLARLAARLTGSRVLEFEARDGFDRGEWRTFLKGLLRQAGTPGAPLVLLVRDLTALDEHCLTDLQSIVSTGGVPSLWSADELSEVAELVHRLPEERPGGPASRRASGVSDAEARSVAVSVDWPLIHGRFAESCRERLHLVLCRSSEGDEGWSRRLRGFPVLLNSCTMDWFSGFPAASLQEVAERLVAQTGVVPPAPVAECAAICQHIHDSTLSLTRRLRSEFGWTFHVTLSSFVNLVVRFTTILTAKQDELAELCATCERGLASLAAIAESLERMRADLPELAPRQEAKRAEIAETEALVAQEFASVEAAQALHEESEQEFVRMEEHLQETNSSCEAELALANKVVSDAMHALEQLPAAEMAELKGMRNHTAPVRKTLEVLCVLKGQKLIITKDKSGAETTDFKQLHAMVADSAVLFQSLKQFEKDKMARETVSEVGRMLEHEDLEPKRVQHASHAIYSLLLWVRAIVKWDSVSKALVPKQALLSKDQAALEEKRREVASKLKLVQAAMASLAELRDRLARQRAELDALTAKSCGISSSVERSSQLVEGLGREGSRWTEQLAVLRASPDHAVGITTIIITIILVIIIIHIISSSLVVLLLLSLLLLLL